jgi:hypothetical protein
VLLDFDGAQATLARLQGRCERVLTGHLADPIDEAAGPAIR